MNTIMVTMLKVLFPYGLSLSYILIHSIIFRNWPTNVSNSSKGVSIPCHVPPLPPKRGLGGDSSNVLSSLPLLLEFGIAHAIGDEAISIPAFPFPMTSPSEVLLGKELRIVALLAKS